ncbi:MAG TPA: Lrp/AsnC family transcriptional regulator [Phycisphaerae bacterium]|nr:Lrp/AsnC family transcriptional regulator [Phycisphaerae bacterium]
MPLPELDQTDAALLSRLQHGLPLVQRPFDPIARELGLGVDQVLIRLRRLKDQLGVIREISAIFDSRALGYQSCLVAAGYQPDQLESAAGVINEHPGVSHNYQRDAELNLWFTLAVPPSTRLGLQPTIDLLASTSGARRALYLPALRVYKIGVRLDLTESHDPTARSDRTAGTSAAPVGVGTSSFSPDDIPVVRALQNDLPIQAEPFETAARQVGVGVDELLSAASRLLGGGTMRRFAAVLRHDRAGFDANVLAAWQVPQDRTDPIGPALGAFSSVSHCYLRPTYPDWPYNVLTMIHGQSRQECLDIIQAMARSTGLDAPAQLWSVKQYKKQRLRYFTGEVEKWEAAHVAGD